MTRYIVNPFKDSDKFYNVNDYSKFDSIVLLDHMDGFGPDLKHPLLDYLSDKNYKNPIYTEYLFDNTVKNNYANLELVLDVDIKDKILNKLLEYKSHTKVKIENFLCSFNGTGHVGRQLLTAILYKFGYFAKDYCSKNFVYSLDRLDGHIMSYCQGHDRFYRKFFITNDSDTDVFYKTIYSFGHNRYDHANNIYTLENKLTTSFLHIVSESLATSYYPFESEKFLYSVVTRGLFLSYAQPGWHRHIEKYHGFKLYTKLFDYKFDSIKNPVERLVELITMISKFSKLSNDELYDLYLMESDTIEYNYDHYFSGGYLEQLKQHAH